MCCDCFYLDLRTFLEGVVPFVQITSNTFFDHGSFLFLRGFSNGAKRSMQVFMLVIIAAKIF